MFTVIGLMLGGMCIGFLLRRAATYWNTPDYHGTYLDLVVFIGHRSRGKPANYRGGLPH